MAAEDVTMQLLSTGLKIVGVGNVLSPLPSSVKMWKTGKTDGWPTMFFAIGLCGSIGMLIYGWMISNSTLIMLQGLQAIMNTYYIFTYTVLAGNKSEPTRYIMGAVMYLSGLYACILACESREKQLDMLGSASGSVFFLMNCSTFLDVYSAISTKTAKFDMVMLIAGMMNSSLWTVYGMLLSDVYMWGPSIPFLITGTIKLILKAVYNASPATKSKKKTQ